MPSVWHLAVVGGEVSSGGRGARARGRGAWLRLGRRSHGAARGEGGLGCGLSPRDSEEADKGQWTRGCRRAHPAFQSAP